MTATEGSLCTGYNGLGMAVEQVLGTELAWYSEVDPAPASVMAHHYLGVPNFGDLTSGGWDRWPPVDVLTAGYPCQPFSTAGKRKGTTDERHLWPYIADIVRVLRPRLVILENVAGHLSLGLDVVLADLAALGFDAEWSVVRASDVGACHQRARLFVVARDAQRPRADAHAPAGASRTTASESGGDAADADGQGLEGWGARSGGGGERPARAGRVAADADPDGQAGRPEQPWGGPGPLPGSEVDERPAVEPGRHGGSDDGGAVGWGEYAGAIDRHAAALGRPAPRPVDERGRLSARFVEWMQMLPEGWVTDHETRRTAALKMLGNGVVPPQAAHALRGLLARASERAEVAA